MNRGYFAIGVENLVKEINLGALFRSAHAFGAKYIFTINKKYKRQSSDTSYASKSLPLFNYESLDAFYENIPLDCRLIGVELCDKSSDLTNFIHPERAVYLLGSESNGLTEKALDKCHYIIKIPYPEKFSLNVSVAGSIIMYDRSRKI